MASEPPEETVVTPEFFDELVRQLDEPPKADSRLVRAFRRLRGTVERR